MRWGRELSRNVQGGTLAGVLLLAATAAQAQPVLLPEIPVTSSRLGGGGIVGTSTSVITAEDIARSPGHSLQDLLSEQPGIQVQNLFGGVNGNLSVVDMRGFGAAAVSNTLVLVNGRRLNDIDMAGVDFGAIPRESIERIEITRGNSGVVLYGDGAMGGVINIITKSGAALPPSLRVESASGSFHYGEVNASASGSSGPFSATAYGTGIDSDGYRFNNRLWQRNGVADLRYTGQDGSAYVTLSADENRYGLPGGRLVSATTNEVASDPRGAATPLDHAAKQGLNATAGITRTLMPGMDLIIDGGVRHKQQQGFFPSSPSFVNTQLTTWSLTPRVNSQQQMFGADWKTIAGIDIYKSVYGSDRSDADGDIPIHHYDIDQTTTGAYVQQTVTLFSNTDISGGVRIERNLESARDAFDLFAPGAVTCIPPFGCFSDAQGLPLDRAETDRAYHAGIEHRLNENFAVFARMAQSFRFPNVDERVGQGPFGTPTTFDLKTQQSHDYEGGFRFRWQRFNLQSSLYDMRLINEIFFSPATFTNVNLDPTRRYGYENVATYELTDAVRLRGGLAYTRAVFREGPFAGNDVPLVSRWTENIGAAWDILGKRLVFDGVVRYVGARRFDNDSANFQPLIPPHAVVDLRLGGELDKFRWSVAVQNVGNVHYFDYGIASAATFGTYNAYPQPGRTVMVRGAVTF